MNGVIGPNIPGALLSSLGAWWIIMVLYRYHKTRRNYGSGPFRSSPSFLHTRVGIQGLLGLSVVLIGIADDWVKSTVQPEYNLTIEHIQRSTVYSVFGLYFASLLFTRCLERDKKEADKINYETFVTALMAEGILLQYQFYGRITLETMLNNLLLIPILLSALLTLCEMRQRDSVFFPLGRGMFTLLQGLWLYQEAYIVNLLIPGLKPLETWTDHGELLLQLLHLFVKEMLAVVIFTGIAYVITGVIKWRHEKITQIAVSRLLLQKPPSWLV